MNIQNTAGLPVQSSAPPSMSNGMIRNVLVAAFPFTFMPAGEAKRPLQIGILKGLTSKLAEKGYYIRGWQLQRAIGDYTSGPTYQREMVTGAGRYDLNGTVVGYVTQYDQDYAEKRLATMGLSFNKLQVASLHPMSGAGLDYARIDPFPGKTNDGDGGTAFRPTDDTPCRRFETRDTPPGLSGCGDIGEARA